MIILNNRSKVKPSLVVITSNGAPKMVVTIGMTLL